MNIINKPSLYIDDPNVEEKNKEILALLYSKLCNSDFYTEECIEFIVGILSNKNIVESSIQVLLKSFREEPCVQLEEKKLFKINTRQKINKKFFDLLSEKGKHQEYVIMNLENIILSSVHKIQNKYKLIEYKALGIKEVEILCCNDDRDCPAVKKHCNKKYPINHVPELPLDECTAELCRCCYVSII